MDLFEAQHIHTSCCLSFAGYQIDTLPSFLVFRSKRVDRVFFVAHEEYLGVVALAGFTVSRGGHTACDPLITQYTMLFVYLQVNNNGVSYDV